VGLFMSLQSRGIGRPEVTQTTLKLLSESIYKFFVKSENVVLKAP